MAKLEQFRQYHYDATVKVSENTRTLSLSAIGIIWLFKKEVNGGYQVPVELLIPLLLVIIAMALDFGQHVYRSIVWHVIFRKEEKGRLARGEISEGTELYKPSKVNTPAYFAFYAKVIVLVLAYFFLLKYFVKAIKWI